jgi:hypothetical protein
MRMLFLLLLSSFILTACGLTPTTIPPTNAGNSEIYAAEIGPTEASDSKPPLETQASADEGGAQINPRVPTSDEYSFSQLLPFDGIRPVYDPKLVTSQEVQDLLQGDELVLGISIEDEAKAYPISVLRFREMVNDEMAGIPTLVTW